MPGYIERFIAYIDKETKKLQENILKQALIDGRQELTASDDEAIDYITQMENIKRQLLAPTSEWPLLGEVFIQFDELSTMMSKAGLKMRDKLEIVIHLLRKNLATEIATGDCVGFDERLVSRHEFKYLTKDEVYDILYDKKYGKYIKGYMSIDDKLTKEEERKVQELKDVIDSYPVDIKDVAAKHVLLKEHLFDKWPLIDEDDIAVVVSILSSFGLHEDICASLGFSLRKQITKREKEKERANLSQPKYVYKYQEGLSDREYKRLNRALRPYFDLNSMVASHPLSLKEQITCTKILMDMLLDDATIIAILNQINRLGLKDNHPIKRYLELYDKLIYYRGEDGIDALITELEQTFKQSFMADSEEYEIIKCVLDDDLNKALTLIPHTYDYERFKAREL